jgi:hypothetical protein
VAVAGDTFVTVVFGRAVSRIWYVATGAGSDDGAGNVADPFRTITRGLAAATEGDTVIVRPGDYRPGETFPLTVPRGVALVGDEDQRGKLTRIVGGGPVPGAAWTATVVLGSRSFLAGLSVTNPGPTERDAAILANGLESAIVACSVVENLGGPGIVIGDESERVLVAGSTIEDNRVGIRFGGAADGHSYVENNRVDSNGVGIAFLPLAVPGKEVFLGPDNLLSCNRQSDVLIDHENVVMNGNYWDHVPPSLSCAMGGDLCLEPPGPQWLTNAKQAAPACP